MDRVFLDANVLFSAAYRSGSGLLRLWKLSDVVLLTSGYAIEEARRNLTGAEARARLESLLVSVGVVAEATDRPLPRQIDLPAKDRPILLAALDARATHLLTGDVRHFGRHYGDAVSGLLILLPVIYLGQRAG